jgi:hypothetical protein
MRLTRRGERVAVVGMMTVFLGMTCIPSGHASERISTKHKAAILQGVRGCLIGGECLNFDERLLLIYRWTNGLREVRHECGRNFVYLVPEHKGPYTPAERRQAWRLGFCTGVADEGAPDESWQGVVHRVQLALEA